jgi:hypothetical protein
LTTDAAIRISVCENWFHHWLEQELAGTSISVRVLSPHTAPNEEHSGDSGYLQQLMLTKEVPYVSDRSKIQVHVYCVFAIFSDGIRILFEAIKTGLQIIFCCLLHFVFNFF